MKSLIRRLALAIAVCLASGLLLATAIQPAAHAARQPVHNMDPTCRKSGMNVLVRDKEGHRWVLKPGQSVNMKWGGRQVWIPSRSYVWKQTGGVRWCLSAWKLNKGQGYWQDFGYKGAVIHFAYMRY